MRSLLLSAAICGSLLASPAHAGEGRAEVNLGIIDEGGESDAIGALVLGYDWDIGETVFVGGEASLEKVFRDEADPSVALGARLGARLAEETKVFVIGGYAFEEEEDRPFIGAGIEQTLVEGIYATASYHRLFGDEVPDADVFGLGVGLEF